MTHRERHAAYMRQWRLRDLEKSRATSRRGARKFRFGMNGQLALERDDYRCVSCGMTDDEHRDRYGRSITIDHIDGEGRNSKNPNNDLDNLQTLCLPCHGRKDAKRRKYRPVTYASV